MSQSNVQLPPPNVTTVRDMGDAISPSYMSGPVWSRYRMTMAIIYDGLDVAQAYAVRARYPGIAPPDALPWIGQDRQIVRGPNEGQASYVARLIQWLDLWRHAGSSMAVMLGMLAFMTPLAPQIATVKASAGIGTTFWLTYPIGSQPLPPGQTNPTPPSPFKYPFASNWDWDGATQPFYYPWMRWREWVIINSPPGDPNSPWAAPTKTWASGGALNVAVVGDPVYGKKYVNQSPASSGPTSFNWGDGTCWGWSGTAAQAGALTSIAVQWKSAGTWIPWIIVSYDPTYFVQTNTIGTKLPDGTWGYYGKIVNDATYGKKYVSARPSVATCTFITGTNDGGGVLGAG